MEINHVECRGSNLGKFQASFLGNARAALGELGDESGEKKVKKNAFWFHMARHETNRSRS